MSETRATSSEISLRQAAKFRGYVRSMHAPGIVTAVMCALLFGTAGTLRYWQA